MSQFITDIINMDLNIVVSCDGQIERKEQIIEKINIAFRLGYDAVALNVIVDPSTFFEKGKKLNEAKIPGPPDISIKDIDLLSLVPPRKRVQIFSRLTIKVSESYEVCSVMRMPIVKKYDLIAHEPTNLKSFQDCVQSQNFDILSLNLQEKLAFPIKRKLLEMSQRSGLFIEIQYAPLIRDKIARRNVIHAAHYMIRSTSKKNFIITSGTDRVTHIRGPYDASNLGTLFGLDHYHASRALNENCLAVLHHAETRKMAKGSIRIIPIEDISTDDNWILKNDQQEEVMDISS